MGKTQRSMGLALPFNAERRWRWQKRSSPHGSCSPRAQWSVVCKIQSRICEFYHLVLVFGESLIASPISVMAKAFDPQLFVPGSHPGFGAMEGYAVLRIPKTDGPAAQCLGVFQWQVGCWQCMMNIKSNLLLKTINKSWRKQFDLTKTMAKIRVWRLSSGTNKDATNSYL